jgi:hypothetical protein
MKYLFILFLFGCGVQAQKIDKDVEFEELMKQVNATNVKSATVLAKATKKEKQLVTNAVATITGAIAAAKVRGRAPATHLPTEVIWCLRALIR